MELNADLETLLFDPGLTRAERLAAVSALGDIRDAVLAGLAASAENADWARFERWLFATAIQPSTPMTPLLCDVLARRLPEVNNEDLVEVLELIADPTSVGCLEDALLWEPDWDEFHALGVKVVWALAAIGTPEARSVLDDAATVGPEQVREMARIQLERLGTA